MRLFEIKNRCSTLRLVNRQVTQQWITCQHLLPLLFRDHCKHYLKGRKFWENNFLRILKPTVHHIIT